MSKHPSPISSEPVSAYDRALSQKRKTAKKRRKTVFRVIRRTLLTLFTIVLLLVVGLCMVLNLIFNGPSQSARDVLTMSLLEASATKWVPALFIGEDTVNQIRNKGSGSLFEDVSDPIQIQINTDTSLSGNSDEWKDYPDGIRIETVSGDTYNAYVMIIRDPSKVYMATSTDEFSRDIPGTRITDQIETEGAIAAINAGAFLTTVLPAPLLAAPRKAWSLRAAKWSGTAAPLPRKALPDSIMTMYW